MNNALGVRWRRAPALALALSLALALGASGARATSIDPLLWQQLAEGAAFVGVVECDQAGGIVARYRVVETWKGAPKPGDAIAIKTAVNIWGPRYPLALVGDRRVVTAYADKAPSRMTSTTFGPRTPPTWMRAVPHDYVLPLFQGSADASATQLQALGTQRTSLAALKKDVVAFLALDEDARATAILRALAAKYDVALPPNGTHRALVQALVERAKLGDAEGIGETKRQTGRAAQRLLQQAAPATQTLARELAPPIDHRDDPPLGELEVSAPPTPDELATARASVTRGMDDDAFSPSMRLLVEHDPAAAVAWAVAWVDPKKRPRDTDAGWFLGSWIAAGLSRDRSTLLAEMATRATEPWMRAAGAVYLAYEDEGRATPILRTLMAERGDPGTWAALALARRGDRAALARAVDVFATPADGASIHGAVHMELRTRVIELLSNTAASVKKPTPLREYEGDRTEADAHKKALAFLRANPAAVPLDPWLPVLKAQRVD